MCQFVFWLILGLDVLMPVLEQSRQQITKLPVPLAFDSNPFTWQRIWHRRVYLPPPSSVVPCFSDMMPICWPVRVARKDNIWMGLVGSVLTFHPHNPESMLLTSRFVSVSQATQTPRVTRACDDLGDQRCLDCNTSWARKTLWPSWAPEPHGSMMGIEDKLNELRIEDQSNEWSTGDKLNVLSIGKNWTHTGEHGHLMMVVVG